MRPYWFALLAIGSVPCSAQQAGVLDTTFAGIGCFTVPSTIVPSVDAAKVRFLRVDDDGNALCYILNADRVRFFRVLESGEVDMGFNGGFLDVLAVDVATGSGLGFLSFKILKTHAEIGGAYLLATNAASSTIDLNSTWFMIRLNESLGLDAAFGTGGVMELDWQVFTPQTVTDFIPLSNGGLMVLGLKGPVFNPGPSNLLLSSYCLRTHADMSVDLTFNDDGTYTVEGMDGGAWATHTERILSVEELPFGGYGLVTGLFGVSTGSSGTTLKQMDEYGSLLYTQPYVICPWQTCPCWWPSPLLVNSNGTMYYQYGTLNWHYWGCGNFRSTVKGMGEPITMDTQPWQTHAVYDLGRTDADGGFLLAKENMLGRRKDDGSRDFYFGMDSVQVWVVDGDAPFTNVAFAPPTCAIKDIFPTPQGQILVSCSTAPNTGAVIARYTNIPDPRARLSLRMFLGGAYDGATGLMRDDLRGQGLLPQVQPYSDLGYAPVNGFGQWSMPEHLLSTEGDSAVVDWIWLELLSLADTSAVVATRVCVVLRNGEVTSADGQSAIDFSVGAGSYFLRVRHRNHLGVTVANPIELGPTSFALDITDPLVPTFGTDAQMEQGGVRMLWPGDANMDHRVKYVGLNNDRDAILLAIGGSTATATVTGYHAEDVNLDGVVKYVGADNDRDIILQVIGAEVNAVRVEQQP